MKARRSNPILFALALWPGWLHAQAFSEYGRPLGDTLRFRERTDGAVVMSTPQGPVTVESEHDAVIALAFGPGDVAWAWYDSLHLKQVGPGPQEQRPPTDVLLGLAFHLTVSPRGYVTMHRAPTFPAAVAAMTDLTHQFDDFLISLPREPLRPGVIWADTLVHTQSGRPQDTYRGARVRNFLALRDTVVAGTPAVLVEVTQDVRVEATSQMEQPGMTARVALEGRDRGLAIFAPSSGRLLHRTRRGALTGHLSLASGGNTVDLPQRYEYTSTISLLP